MEIYQHVSDALHKKIVEGGRWGGAQRDKSIFRNLAVYDYISTRSCRKNVMHSEFT